VGEDVPPQLGGINSCQKRGTTMSGTTQSTSTLLTRRGALRALALLCTLSLGLGGTRAWADGELNFKLKNRLGKTIRSVYVSPHQADSWEDDVLGDDTLADGRDIRIRFDRTEERRGDIWDLKVVDSDDNSHVWKNFNLTKINEITIYLRGGRVIAESK
jgi:hypothetical protein